MPRLELLKRVGSIHQLAGAKRYVLADGRGAGVECVDVRTGSGLCYTVMPGRGMDIGCCEFKGIPIAYLSKVGISAPAYFTGVKDQWRQCFPGGLLSTCGLGNVGPFCTDETAGIGAQDFSQHGRISNQCAENICLQERWHGEQFEVTVSGTVHEAQLRAEHFSLCRTVRSCLGESRIFIDDVITNEDYIERPCMFLYHMNFGYPLIDAGAQILLGAQTPLDASQTPEKPELLPPPQHGASEALSFFRTCAKQDVAAIYNRQLSVLVYIRYSADTMPYLTKWKMLAEADYVVGLEAGNCTARGGRAFHRAHECLPMLAGQAQIRNSLEIGVLHGEAEIAPFLKDIGAA